MVQAPPIVLSLATVALSGFLKTPELELGDEQEWSGDYEVLLEILALKIRQHGFTSPGDRDLRDNMENWLEELGVPRFWGNLQPAPPPKPPTGTTGHGISFSGQEIQQYSPDY